MENELKPGDKVTIGGVQYEIGTYYYPNDDKGRPYIKDLPAEPDLVRVAVQVKASGAPGGNGRTVKGIVRFAADTGFDANDFIWRINDGVDIVIPRHELVYDRATGRLVLPKPEWFEDVATFLAHTFSSPGPPSIREEAASLHTRMTAEPMAEQASEDKADRVFASTGVLQSVSPNNAIVGVTAHCKCGHIFADDVVAGLPKDMRGREQASKDADEYVDVVFDGRSIKIGEWIQRPDGWWVLRIPRTSEVVEPRWVAPDTTAERIERLWKDHRRYVVPDPQFEGGLWTWKQWGGDVESDHNYLTYDQALDAAERE